MNNNKGGMILLIVIAVATLLVAVAGATFAYFGASGNKSNEDKTIEVTSGTLSTEYTDGSKINAGALNPGDLLVSKTFIISGLITGSSNLNYEADLVINNNTYADGELVYTITSTNDLNNGSIIPSTDPSVPVSIPTGNNTVLLGKGVFAGPLTDGATHTYVINIYASSNEVNDPNKSFDATIKVKQATN